MSNDFTKEELDALLVLVKAELSFVEDNKRRYELAKKRATSCDELLSYTDEVDRHIKMYNTLSGVASRIIDKRIKYES